MHDEDRVPWVNGHAGRVVGPPSEVGAFDRRVQYPETVRVVVELPRDVYLAAGAAADAASADGEERFARDEAIARFAALGVQLGAAGLAPDAPALLTRVLESVSDAPSPLAALEERARGKRSG